VYTYIHIHVYIHMCIYIDIYIYVCMYTHLPGTAVMDKDDTFLCKHLYIYMYTYIYTHIHVYIYIYIYTYMYMYTYAPARRCCYEKRRHSSILLTQDSRGSTSAPLDPACTNIMWVTACLSKVDVEIVSGVFMRHRFFDMIRHDSFICGDLIDSCVRDMTHIRHDSFICGGIIHSCVMIRHDS